MINFNEIFKYPLLSEVILDLRFPIRFDMANYIADFQKLIEKYFPIPNEAIVQDIKLSVKGESDIQSQKVWEFSNPQDKTICRIFRNKFSLVSNKYKFWKKKEKLGFRDIIERTFQEFTSLVPIKKFDRIGLRYINKDKIEIVTSEWFKKYFIPLFNPDKYDIQNLNENYVRIKLNKSKSIGLTIQTVFIIENNEKYYILDFDAFSKEVEVKNALNCIESLHEVILKEFHSLITDECRNKMRGK